MEKNFRGGGARPPPNPLTPPKLAVSRIDAGSQVLRTHNQLLSTVETTAVDR